MEITYKEFIDNIIESRGRHGCGEEYHESRLAFSWKCATLRIIDNVKKITEDESAFS